ncbi:MAG: lytic transglycosylase domain-containing protein [Proteobacteria bacterium]|nr:lytic transglycosylase domain-containing protein [Pseudomonadota bacterium]
MKSVINKKLTLQLLSLGLIRLLFIGVMILSVTFAYNRNSQKMISSPSLKGEYLAAGTEYRSSSIGRKKAERVLHPIVIQAASRHQVDPALIKAIIMAESGYNTRAISKRGAKGLMQLMPATAQALGVVDVFNPKQNISGGVRYFKKLVTQFDGDVKLALAAYNAGSRNVRHYQGIPPFKETRFYIKKVFKYYEIYKDQMAYTENGIVFLNNNNHYS